MSKIAIIGTAGRDITQPMTKQLWYWMVRDVASRVPRESHVVSGGAAWADHLSVYLFLVGHAAELTLHLPAPFDGQQFIGPLGRSNSASAANFYHNKFSRIVGANTLAEIEQVIKIGANVTFEPSRVGYAGMMNRNSKVAKAEELLAYTFTNLSVPNDGGTKDTWCKCQGKRTHISLPTFKD